MTVRPDRHTGRMGTPATAVETVATAVAAAEELVAQLGSISSLRSVVEDELFSRVLTTTGNGDAMLQAVSSIEAAAAHGHDIRLELVDDADGILAIVWRRGMQPDIQCDSELVQDPNDRIALTQARDSGDVPGVLGPLRQRAFRLRVSLRAAAPGAAWIPSEQKLSAALSSGAWLSAVQQLARNCDDDRAVLLVDKLAEPIITPAFAFVASADPHAAAVVHPPLPASDGRIAAYLTARRDRGWVAVPVPDALVPISGRKTRLGTDLATAAGALAWYWLAAEPPGITVTSVDVRYQGVRDVELLLTPSPGLEPRQLDDVLSLFHWAASSGDDRLRSDAVQRAITLAVASPNDLPGAARPALRTAKTLHDLATSGAVAEALSARHAARDAAATAARSAATAAREASGKATERSLALSAAAAGVVFASLQKIIDRSVALGSLVVLIVLLLASCLVATKVDFTSARNALTSFEEDIDRYREALSKDDVDDVKKLAVISTTRGDIDRAKVAVKAVYVGAVIIAALLGGLLFLFPAS